MLPEMVGLIFPNESVAPVKHLGYRYFVSVTNEAKENLVLL